MTIWTIRIALGLFALAFLARNFARRSDETQVVARWFWTIATLVYLAHVVSAFHFVHDWSHSAAMEQTARQSEEVTGIRFGGGIYFNHLFTFICLIETAWWWWRPVGFQQRPKWLLILIYGYLLFIGINGAIIFVASPTRWISLTVLALLMVVGATSKIRRSKVSE